MLEAYIYDGARTPFGRQDGALSRVRPDDMLGDVIKVVVARSGFSAESIDDVNRGVRQSSWQSKPPGQENPTMKNNTSTEFVNITRPYVDAAASKVGDILLPTDERSWSLSETPIPELIDKAQRDRPS